MRVQRKVFQQTVGRSSDSESSCPSKAKCRPDGHGWWRSWGDCWQIVIPESEVEEIARWILEKRALRTSWNLCLKNTIPTFIYMMCGQCRNCALAKHPTSTHRWLTDELPPAANNDGLLDCGRVAESIEVSTSHCRSIHELSRRSPNARSDG